jgi:hypothetical protein
MGWLGQYTKAGQCLSSSFPNAASTNKSEQVVISALVGRNWGGGDIKTGQDSSFHLYFQMQLLQTRVVMIRGQVVFSATVGWE